MNLEMYIICVGNVFRIYTDAVNSQQGIVAQALFLGDASQFNSTRDDCLWKRGNERDTCPDKDIRMILYTSFPNSIRSVVSILVTGRKAKLGMIMR